MTSNEFGLKFRIKLEYDELFHASEKNKRPLPDYTVLDGHVFTDDVHADAWFFYRRPIVREEVTEIVSVLNASSSTIYSLYNTANKSSFFCVGVRSSVIDSTLGKVSDRSIDSRIMELGDMRTLCPPLAPADHRYVRARTFAVDPQMRANTLAILSEEIDGFYGYLLRHSFSHRSINMRVFLHHSNSVIVSRDFMDVAMKWYHHLVNDRTSVEVFADCVRCLASVFFAGDYGGFPLVSDLVSDRLRCFFDDLVVDARRQSGDAPVRIIIDDRDIRSITHREIFYSIGLTPDEIEDVFVNNMTYSYGAVLSDEVADQQDQSTVGTRQAIIAFHASATACRANSIRRRVLANVISLSSFVTLRHGEYDGLRAISYVSVELILRKTVYPVVAAFVQGERIVQGGDRWYTFSTHHDFLDNFVCMSTVYRQGLFVTDCARSAFIAAMCKIVLAISDREKQRIRENPFWFEWAQRGGQEDVIKRRMLDALDKLTGEAKSPDLKLEGTDVVAAIMIYGLEFGEDLLSYRDIFTFGKNESASEISIVEPIPNKIPTGLLACVLDPRLYLYYFAVRLIRKAFYSDTITLGQCVEKIETLALPLSRVFVFIYTKLSAVTTFVPRDELYVRARDILEVGLPRAATPSFDHQGDSEGQGKNIMRVLPVYQKRHREYVIDQLFAAMFERFGGDVDKCLVKADHRLDINTLISLFSGSGFVSFDGMHSAFLKSVAKDAAEANPYALFEIDMALEQAVSIRARNAAGSVSDGRVVRMLGENQPTSLTLRVKLDLLVFGRSTGDTKVDFFWLWTPLRDDRKQTLIVTKRQRIRLSRIDAVFSLTNIPLFDGMEGTYVFVIGAPLLGYVRRSIRVDIRKRCVRTGRVYSEADNSASAARWEYEGRELIGWLSDSTVVPYLSSFPIDHGFFIVHPDKRYLGDFLYVQRDIPSLLFRSVDFVSNYAGGFAKADYFVIKCLFWLWNAAMGKAAVFSSASEFAADVATKKRGDLLAYYISTTKKSIYVDVSDDDESIKSIILDSRSNDGNKSPSGDGGDDNPPSVSSSSAHQSVPIAPSAALSDDDDGTPSNGSQHIHLVPGYDASVAPIHEPSQQDGSYSQLDDASVASLSPTHSEYDLLELSHVVDKRSKSALESAEKTLKGLGDIWETSSTDD